ncbi:MAG: SLBB domain-containing protein [Ignavibacteriales bacterium]|nr:SLBB domain-containing protein [Ignavibacteriales bacterium]
MIKQNQSMKFWNLKTTILSLCMWCVFMLTSNAQWTTDTKKELQESKSDLKSMIQAPVSNVPPMEGPVDPEKYFIGPSDVLSVNIWVSPPLNFSLTVTPEGTLIVPTVGEVPIVDLSLKDAKKRIIEEIKKKYITGNPTVTLLTPRQFSVTVTGAVRFPGKYILYATDRVDKAVAEANKITEENKLRQAHMYIRDDLSSLEERFQSKRNIRLTRRSGEIVHIDIPKYFATRDAQYNQLLREGDEVFVPRIDSKKNIFGVYGGVNAQGSFELVKGEHLIDAIELAYGLTARAKADSILLFRYDVKKGTQVMTVYDFHTLIHDSLNTPVLVAGDRIVVQEQPDVREDYRVIVEGEVNYPGTYPLSKDSTKLSTVIEWCGGFTEYASLASAQVYRGTVSREEVELEKLLSLRGSIAPEDSSYYLMESELHTKREVVNVDFRKLFIDKDLSEDVYLRNGDYISIPSVRKTIYVFGQVTNPGNVPFVAGKNYEYYIQRAGGFTDKARTGDVMIIKRSTHQWLAPDETKIEEGDYVWVPKKIERTFAYYMSIFSQTAAVITAAVSIALLAIQLKK